MAKKTPTVRSKATPQTIVSTSNSSVPSLLRPIGHWWQWVLLMFLTIGIYYQCTNYGYVLDDLIVINENDFTKKGFAGIYDIMTTESMTGYFKEQKNLVEGNRYRPLSLVTFAMEHGIMGGQNPKVSHWINILLYGLSCILLFQLLSLLFANYNQRIKHGTYLALGITMLYLVHPLHVEAVANIKGRDEIMAFMLAILATIMFYKQSFSRSKKELFGASTAYLLALLSKENAITFVAIIPLTIYVFSANKWSKSIWPLLLVTIAYLMLRFWASGVPEFGNEGNDLMNNPFLEMTGIERISTIMYTLLLYLKLMILPYPLTHDYYPYTIPKMNMTSIWVLLSWSLYLAGGAWALLNLKKRSIIAYGILFYLLALSIMSNIVINLGTFMNDRFVYMASAGLCISLGYGIYRWYERGSYHNILSIVVGIVALIGLAGLSWGRVPAWKDALSLNKSAIKVSKNSARANSFMSTALFEQGRAEQDVNKKLALMNEALPYAVKACEIHPSYYNSNLMLAGIAGEIYKINGDIDVVVKHFETTMIARPDVSFISEFCTYLNRGHLHADKLIPLYKRVGTKLIQRNKGTDLKWAITYLSMVLEEVPNEPEAIQLLAQAYEMSGNPTMANQVLSKLQ